jgi:hypothetical protein
LFESLPLPCYVGSADKSYLGGRIGGNAARWLLVDMVSLAWVASGVILSSIAGVVRGIGNVTQLRNSKVAGSPDTAVVANRDALS